MSGGSTDLGTEFKRVGPMGVARMALPMVAEPSMPLQSTRPIFALSHAVETLPSRDSSLRHWQMTDPVPRVLVDRNLRVVWSNDAATAFQAQRRDLEVRNAALGAVDSTQYALLVDAIRASTDTTRCWELLSAEDRCAPAPGVARRYRHAPHPPRRRRRTAAHAARRAPATNRPR